MTHTAPQPTIGYHKDCSDGFGAALAAYQVFGPRATYVGLTHGDRKNPEFREGADLYLLDFTFNREVLLGLAKKHPKIVIIDHHKTAVEALDGIEALAPNIEVTLEMNNSGAVLAWEYFHSIPFGTPVPPLLRYIEDRDLWRWKLANSREINEAIYSYPQEFPVWRKLLTQPIETFIVEGTALRRNQQKNVETLLRQVRAGYIDGRIVPTVNCPYFYSSDVGHALLQKYPDAPFSANYRVVGDGSVHWSLRSEDSRMDVSEIAKRMNGGGHRNAAGFETADDTPYFLYSVGTYDDYLASRAAGRID